MGLSHLDSISQDSKEDRHLNKWVSNLYRAYVNMFVGQTFLDKISLIDKAVYSIVKICFVKEVHHLEAKNKDNSEVRVKLLVGNIKQAFF